MWSISKEHTVEISAQQWELEHFVNIVILTFVFIQARGYALYNDTSLLRIFTLKFVTLPSQEGYDCAFRNAMSCTLLNVILGFLFFLTYFPRLIPLRAHMYGIRTPRLTPSQGPHLLPLLVKLRQRRGLIGAVLLPACRLCQKGGSCKNE